MNLDLLRGNRNLLFWGLHTLGWSAYGLAQFVGTAIYGVEPGYVQVITIAAVSGFVLSAPLRWLYRRLWAAGPRTMLVCTLIACWITALVWRAIMNIAYVQILKPEWAGNLATHPLDIFQYTLYSMALLLAWTALYYGVKFYERLQLEREATLKQSALAQEAQDPIKKVTLRQELDALNLYLGIEKLRFGDRLRLEFEVDERAESALVPSLLLQPLVENAMKYAIAPREQGGAVTVIAGIEGRQLRLAVVDDGPGLPPAMASGNGRGVGLRNTRERLKVLYGDAHSVEVADASPGLAVEMRLPLEV
jgi:two-component system LytT family sensor kinase